MTASFEEAVPYPGPQADAVLPSQVANGFTGPVPGYADPSWSLAALAHAPGASRPTIHWETVPEAFREDLRHLTWLLINAPLPASFLIGKPSRWRTTVSPRQVYPTVERWRAFCRWLEARGRASLTACTPADLRAYALHVGRDRGMSRSSAQKALAALTRLWALDSSNNSPAGFCEPPWMSEGADDFLPAGSSTGENSTEPITPEAMGPLLVWALRVVEDFAEDILSAVRRKEEILATSARTATTPEGWAALEAYLGRFVAEGVSPPSMAAGNRTGLAAKYISYMTGASIRQVHRQTVEGPWRDQLLAADGPAPVLAELSGKVEGRPWKHSIDYSEVRSLRTHLTTAAYIVISYLTGMRPGEVQGLERGCCPQPESGRHLIRATVFKTAIDDAGNHVPQGIPREVPWVAIDPVVRAIRIVERMVPEGYLFGNCSTSTMNSRIERFSAWASDLARALDRPHEAIPEDRHGPVGASRFRRTLAWHIARRPGGLVALAVQYGHMRTAMSAGYASRSRNGIHDLLDVETALAVADTLASLNEDLENGTGISGPAARRAVNAAQHAPEFAGTIVTARQARALLENPALTVYENPSAMLMCVYRADRALCNRVAVREAPRLDRCVSSCANIARTDGHAHLMRQEADSLERQAPLSPQPLQHRLRARAERLREGADLHDRSRIVLEEAE
ncbi:hypothetical protein GCM10012320_33940 [Sinomonas cellulolyticus]|uniref:Integrase n=1 Tax=Sinomonas cellulolyticus TaxID=2801916 RepID=A0ABS1K9L8_9MICC|nr:MULTISPECIES: integrase [Sinomonas]MBL0707006.1 hypothetical protein [Sinomonas cellulolyticus]GHG59690.1 hypothetical protein GCM10012320_33940 [Sinomonas sp. KCTC 49339]